MLTVQQMEKLMKTKKKNVALSVLGLVLSLSCTASVLAMVSTPMATCGGLRLNWRPMLRSAGQLRQAQASTRGWP